jgi:penicillin-binding protein 1A
MAKPSGRKGKKQEPTGSYVSRLWQRTGTSDGKPDGPKTQGPKTKTSKKARPTLNPKKCLGDWLRFLAYWGIIGTVWAGISFLIILGIFAYDLPNPTDLSLSAQNGRLVILADDGKSLDARGGRSGRAVEFEDIPEHLKHAVIATEDRRFYSHFGIDTIGLARAMFTNIFAGRVVQGGSTLTQQLAKNAFLSHERTLKRKVQEALLSIWLERNYTKNEIITFYLNRVYLGAGSYGVDAASHRYFGRSVNKLTVMQSAIIAGLLKAPSRYAPSRDLKRSRQRANVVLANMVAIDYLTPKQAEQAKREKIVVKSRHQAFSSTRYFTDWIIDSLPDYIGDTDQALVVETTLSSRSQRGAALSLQKHLNTTGKKLKAGQGAIVILDETGAVKAMVGGKSYATSQYNRAVNARRQPGSAFKAFVFATGFAQGHTPDSIMHDGPVVLEKWEPKNYNKGYDGDMTLREAFSRSINTVAVKLSEKSGRDRVINMAHNLGIESSIPSHPSVALGTADVGVLEMAQSYVPFANGGQGVIGHGVKKISLSDGTILYQRKDTGLGRVLDSLVISHMADVFKRAVKTGTGKNARIKGRVVRGKTGTSQGNRDAWFVGFADGLTSAVWVGNDNGSPMRNVTGAGIPARVWRDAMVVGLKGRKVTQTPPIGATSTGKSLLDSLLDSFKLSFGDFEIEIKPSSPSSSPSTSQNENFTPRPNENER